jgi:hypothetical protein
LRRIAGLPLLFLVLDLSLYAWAAGRGAVALERTIQPGERPPPATAPADDAAPTPSGDTPGEPDDPGDTAPSDPDEPFPPEETPVVGGVELATDSFEIPRASLVRIQLSAPQVEEAWAAVDIALVKGADSVTHILDGELSHYAGDDDDPDEESRSDTLYAWVDDPGTYHLLVRTMGGAATARPRASCRRR